MITGVRTGDISYTDVLDEVGAIPVDKTKGRDLVNDLSIAEAVDKVKEKEDAGDGDHKGESEAQYEGQKYDGERKPENDFVNNNGNSTLDKHANKHGYESPNDYLNDARNFLEKAPTSTAQSFASKDGTYFRYDTNTNEFGIINQYGGISTYFKPDDGLAYWLEQINLYAP